MSCESNLELCVSEEDKHKHLMKVQRSSVLESLEMLFWMRVGASGLQVFMDVVQSQFVTCWLQAR